MLSLNSSSLSQILFLLCFQGVAYLLRRIKITIPIINRVRTNRQTTAMTRARFELLLQSCSSELKKVIFNYVYIGLYALDYNSECSLLFCKYSIVDFAPRLYLSSEQFIEKLWEVEKKYFLLYQGRSSNHGRKRFFRPTFLIFMTNKSFIKYYSLINIFELNWEVAEGYLQLKSIQQIINSKTYIQIQEYLFQQIIVKIIQSKKMIQHTNQVEAYRETDPIYPTINVYSSSRVANQRVNNSKIPLLKYREPIAINNCSKSYDSEFVDPNLLRKFQTKDGLIHTLKMMKRQLPQVGSIKILICVCMYNESKHAINLTLNGIYKNLPHMRSQGISDGDVAVVLIQDGLLKLVSDRVKRTYAKGENSMVKLYELMDRNEGKSKCDLIQRINVILDEAQNYDRKGMKKKVNLNRDIPPSIQKNIALVYQNIWRPSKTYFEDSDLKKPPNTPQGLRVFSCFKHTNGTKLSSHLWFFEGFCRYLKPQFCVLLDVGTTPGKHGLVNLIRGFSGNPNIGGVSGFMSVDTNFKSQEGGEEGDPKKQNCCTKNIFSIQKAQQYQYIISHFLDKNQESALGFLHVLPGAWSGYRYEALIKSQKYQPNLLERSYFKMILNPDLEEKDYAEANMYLAEDRILSLGIYCQMDSKYILRYVPDAKAYTDPMKDHQNLMNQRRRWINSSLFAFLYVYKNYYYNVMDSRHSFCRKYCTLNLSMIIALLSLFNTYITPALYFFILYATIYQLGFPGSEWVAKLVCMLYVFVFFSAVGGAITGRAWSKRAHVISAILAGFTFLMIILVIFNVLIIYLRITKNPLYVPKENQQPLDSFDLSGKNKVLLIVLTLSVVNIVCFFLVVLMHLPTHAKFVCKLLMNTPSYMAYTGAYSQTMVIHAFCNVDDVSWGTKGSSGSGGKKYEIDKVFFVSSWLFVNAVLAFIFLYIDIISRENGVHQRGDVVLVAIAIYGTVFMLLKTVLAMYNHFKWMCCVKCCTSLTSDKTNRMSLIDQYWKKQYQQWNNDYYKKSMVAVPSVIIPRQQYR